MYQNKKMIIKYNVFGFIFVYIMVEYCIEFGWCSMKKFLKENLVIIIIVFVFILAVGIGLFFVIGGMKNSQEDIEKQVLYVDEKYKDFSNDSSSVSEKRTKIYNEVFNNAYYVDFSTKDESWKTSFTEYYNLIEFAGSDNHSGSKKKNLAGVCSDKPIFSEREFVKAVKNGEMKVFYDCN